MTTQFPEPEAWDAGPEDDPRINDETPLEQQLFEMVYKWGRYGVVVDHSAPAYLATLDRIKQQAKEVPF